MTDREKVIKGLEEAEIMLAQAVDRGGEMAAMGAFKCYNHVSDALATLKEQDAVIRCKDCKHGEKVNSVYLCGKSRGFVIAHEPDWFCADGEKESK